MKAFAIALTPEEAGLIVRALAERPFREVFETIAHLNRQAHAFAAGDQAHAERHVFALDAAELALAVGALGALPFDQVCGLIAALHGQIAQQQDAAAA